MNYLRHLSEIQERAYNSRKVFGKIYPDKARSYLQDNLSATLNAIPKNREELLSRYGSTRFKVPDVKKGAVALLAKTIAKPLKRIFWLLKKKSKLVNFSKNLKFEKIRSINCRNPEDPSQCFRRNHREISYLKGIEIVVKVFSFTKNKISRSLFKKINDLSRKTDSAVVVNGFLYTKICASIRAAFYTIMNTNLNKCSSLEKTRIPFSENLNLEKKHFSPYFNRDSEHNHLAPDSLRKISDHTCNLTERRSEIPSHLIMPSLISSDFENSELGRSDFKNKTRRKFQSFQLKNADRYFDLDSIQYSKKPASKKIVFRDQPKKNYSESLQFFTDNYELFSLEKVLKQYSEKMVTKGFFKWKFWVKKQRKTRAKVRSRLLEKSYKKFQYLMSKGIVNRFLLVVQVFHSCARREKIKNLIKNLEKDVRYRVSVCFTLWKKKSVNFYIDKLKVISISNSCEYLFSIRKSWAFSIFKIINFKSIM